MKKCSKCLKWRPTDRYYKSSMCTDGLQGVCKDCRAKEYKEKMQQKKEEQLKFF